MTASPDLTVHDVLLGNAVKMARHLYTAVHPRVLTHHEIERFHDLLTEVTDRLNAEPETDSGARIIEFPKRECGEARPGRGWRVVEFPKPE